ncbi:hypothetical protein NC652_040811 [Populus alba x Populus x berolinensis]|nr:hypothetical protein NC652_040811 [Populus alba x Populus x berolinensis]
MLDHDSKGFASMFSLYCLEQPSSIDQMLEFKILLNQLNSSFTNILPQ